MNNSFFTITHGDKVVALVIRQHHQVDDLEFFTQPEQPLQVGMHHKPSGHHVQPHVHTALGQVIDEVHEVFFIVRGKVRLTMYDRETAQKIKSVILESGDAAIHMGEGHGLDFLQETWLFEVKQGPYSGVETAKLYLASSSRGKGNEHE
jgi:hypothetical protein